MQYPFLNFLRSSLVPELCANVTAGASGNVHFVLIAIITFRTAPNKFAVFLFNLNFAVVSANLTMVAFGVEFGIHNVIVNKLHNAYYRF